MRIKLSHSFDDIVSLNNLLKAWEEFVSDKNNKPDIQEFRSNLMNNILLLRDELVHNCYNHSGYEAFNISDPKPRRIHKTAVCDRLLHHAICRILYPFFDRTFSADSYSSRVKKGTHKSLNRFREFFRKVSKNNNKTCWVLKCDIRKFFDNIDHKILIDILKSYILDQDIIWLLEKVIYSFSKTSGKGLPLGNLTSQLFVNIYMNEFDQFVKHRLKAKYYIRYADDFVVLSRDKPWLEELLFRMGDFLEERLKLSLHPDKLFIKTLSSGVDFLGWVHFPGHRVLRTTTKRRMLKKLGQNSKTEVVASYFGLLSHGNTNKIKKMILSKHEF